MDGAIHLDPAIGAQPSPAFMGFFAALANVRAAGEAVAEAEITLAEGEAAINRGIEAIARMVAKIARPRRAAADLIGTIASRGWNSTRLKERATRREYAG